MNEESQKNEEQVFAEWDLSGLVCPEPVMMLHVRVREVPGGVLLRVLATDPSTVRDIPRFCRFLGHDLIAVHSDEGLHTFLFRTSRESSP